MKLLEKDFRTDSSWQSTTEIDTSKIDAIAFTSRKRFSDRKFPSFRFNEPLEEFKDYRLIISQAMVEQLPIVGVDKAFDSYAVRRLW